MTPRSPPVAMCAAALAFWALKVGGAAPIVAAVLACGLEGTRLLPARLSIRNAAVARLFDFGLMGGFVLVGVISLDQPVAQAVTVVMHWLPALLAPFTLTQAWSTRSSVDIKALWWARQRRDPAPLPPYWVDFRWLYVPIVLIAAGAASGPGMDYFVVVAVLAAWAVFDTRRPGRRVVALVVALAVAIAIGYGTQRALHVAQGAIAEFAVNALAGSDDTDPFRRRTAIGDIGEIKLSDSVIVRVWPDAGEQLPRYLHRATYNVYGNGAWAAGDAALVTVEPAAPGNWVIHTHDQAPVDDRTLRLATVHDGGRAVLAAPFGTRIVRSPVVNDLRRNPFGVLELSAPSVGTLPYEVRYASSDQVVSAGERDTLVPKNEAAALHDVAARIGLIGAAPADAVRRIEAWFSANFAYSLYQAAPAAMRAERSPLMRFLAETRAGHCEYFATATVLLLRVAGVPARYVTGYAVEEWSPLEAAFVIRRRHAHSWVRVFVDDAWRNVDTTPSNWVDEERAEAPVWQPVADVVNWLLYRLALWRASSARAAAAPWAMLILVVIGAVVIWRARRRLAKLRVRRQDVAAEDVQATRHTGALTVLEVAMAEQGLGRNPAELPSHWAARTASAMPADAAGAFSDIIALHSAQAYGARADAARQLEDAVAKWLSSWPTVAHPDNELDRT